MTVTGRLGTQVIYKYSPKDFAQSHRYAVPYAVRFKGAQLRSSFVTSQNSKI